MQFEGVKGEVTAPGYIGWIELYSAQMGTNRRVTNPTGRGTNRESNVPSVSEIVVTKPQDNASTGLFQASLRGEGKKVKIVFTKKEGKVETSYMEIELEGTMVSNYNVSGHGGDDQRKPMESLSLNFTQIKFKTTGPVNPDADKPERAQWDLAPAGK
ncbi:MAG: Hcp family type VI secretion system effector [Gemmataceae bacterium]